jgi:UDP-N-acetylbacillosamine N-acetyltransferase
MKVIIFGIGDLANQLHYYLSQDSTYDVECFCVTREYFSCSEFSGKKVLVLEDIISRISKDEYKFILGIGYKNLRDRKYMFETIKNEGYSFINYIHPTARIYGEILGEGNIILSNVTIEPFSKVYDNNIIWSNNLICHDSIIGNHNFIAANCVIGGHSKVLENNFIGFNSTIVHNVIIDKEVLIGAKSLVLKSTENHSTYCGAPIRKVKEHYEEGIRVT